MTQSKNPRREALYGAFRAAFPNTIPVLTGFLALGTGYGLLMQSKGYGLQWSLPMSLLVFAGSMQYVAVTLLTTVFDPIQAFLMSIMVNARHLVYGLSMLDKYKGLGKARFFLIYMLCDETYSIASSIDPPEGVERKYFYLFISVLDDCYWFTGTAIGAILGGLIKFDITGVDFVLTALFVVLFIEQLRDRGHIPSGVIGVLSSVAALLIFGGGNMVIPAMLIILVILLVGREKLCS